LAIERSIFRLPRDGVGTVAGDDVRGFQSFPVGQDRGRLNNPFVTLVAPDSFTNGAVCHKTPRAQLRGSWIAADPLGGTGYQGLPHRRALGRDKEVILRRPLEGNVVDFRPFSLIDPFANRPLQSAQVFVVAGWGVRRFAHAQQNPLAVFFYMNIAVAGLAGRRTVRGDNGRYPILDGRLRRDEAHRIYVDAQLQAFVLGEEILERIFNGGASLQLAPVEIHVIAILRPKGRHGFGVTFFKGLGERLRILVQRCRLLCIAMRCLVGLGFLGLDVESAEGCRAADRNKKNNERLFVVHGFC
jgi:hypothetical protein